ERTEQRYLSLSGGTGEPFGRRAERDIEAPHVTEREQFRVTLSIPWLVRGVDSVQDAVNIAVSEVGRRVTTAEPTPVSTGEITVQTLSCTNCGATTEAALVVAETALVGLALECTVTAQSPDDAESTVRRELGSEFEDVPLVPIESVREDA
ncbi:MAG: DUF555 domain-containing protein, partial [Halobacteriales archaeon]|nr:DUF555 domain-containing protein [Halobacteriales archaeon]